MQPPIDSPDVFLSYASADAEWAENWLMPQLESNGVKILNANLLAGSARIDQLANFAEKARHTLLILSPDWVTSQWETFTGLISHTADPLGQQRKTIPLIRQSCTPPRSIARLISADFRSEQSEEWERQLTRLLAVFRGQKYRTALGPPLGALLGLDAPTNFIYPKNQHFVGRDQELAELHQLLDDAIPLGVNAARPNIDTESRLAGLTGLGGVGKTQLVVEYIYRYGKAYPGGIFWINAADGVADDFAEIGKRILGNGHDKTDLELIRIAHDYLRSDPDTLLVLDNLNDLSLLNQPAAGILSPMSLPCRLLFTTRRRDLHGIRSIAVDMLAEADALRLLLRSRPEILESDHPEHSLAIRVCATLGGLPLAIEMAAAYLEQELDVSLTGYLKRLGKEGALQTLENFEQAKEWSSTWHDPIQITLQSQWDAVANAPARLLLQAGAMMPEGQAAPIGLLSLLTGLKDIADEGFPTPFSQALRELHKYSLIEVMEKARQVRLHPLVREFSRAQINEPAAFAKQCSTNMTAALEDLLYVNQVILKHGVDALLTDLAAGLKMSPGILVIEDLRLVLDQEAHNLRRPFVQIFPAYTLQQIRSRAFSLGKVVLLARVEDALNNLKFSWFRERVPSWQESSALIRMFERSSDSPTALAITPDGKRALSAYMDSSFSLWDLETGQSLHALEGHSGWVNTMTITPDGKRVLSTSIDKTLRLWDLESGKCLLTFVGHTSVVDAIDITSDGKRALSGSADKTLRLWDLESGKCLHTFKGHSRKIEAVTITSDGKRALSGSSDKTLRLWDLETGQCLCTFKGHSGEVTGVVITPDDKYAVSRSADKTLRLWDLEHLKGHPILKRLHLNTARALQTFKSHSGIVNAAVLIPGGKRLLSASLGLDLDNSLRLWDLETGQSLPTFEAHDLSVTAMTLTPDGKRALFACLDGTFRLWDLETGRSLYNFGYSNVCTAIAVTPDGKHALSASQDGIYRLWDLQALQNLLPSERHLGDIASVVITPNGKFALSRSRESFLRLWDLERGQCLRIFEGHTGIIAAMDITSDGKHVLSGAWDNTLRLWDLETGQGLRVFEGYSGKSGALTISPDNKRALAAYSDVTLRLWDLETGQSLHTFEGHSGTVETVAITRDGKRALSGSSDNTLRLWDLEGGKCLYVLQGHSNIVSGVVIMPDDRRALSISYDNTLRLWDLERGKCLHVLEGHSNLVRIMGVTRDGKRVLSGSMDHTLRLWDLESGQSLHIFEGITDFTVITRDCKRALSTSSDRTLRLWDLESGQILMVYVDEVLDWITLHENQGRLLIVGFSLGRPQFIEYVDGINQG